MPLYEFRCPSGHAFEKFYRSIGSAPSEENCPECGKAGVRLMSAAGLVFKGSGFYITDYGKDGKKDLRAATAQASASDAKGEAKSDATGEPKSDAKGEPKSDAKGEAKSDAASSASETAAPKPADVSASKGAAEGKKTAPVPSSSSNKSK